MLQRKNTRIYEVYIVLWLKVLGYSTLSFPIFYWNIFIELNLELLFLLELKYFDHKNNLLNKIIHNVKQMMHFMCNII